MIELNVMVLSRMLNVGVLLCFVVVIWYSILSKHSKVEPVTIYYYLILGWSLGHAGASRTTVRNSGKYANLIY